MVFNGRSGIRTLEPESDAPPIRCIAISKSDLFQDKSAEGLTEDLCQVFSKCQGEFTKDQETLCKDQQTSVMSEVAVKVCRSLAETCDLFDKCKVDKENVISLSTHLESLGAAVAPENPSDTTTKFRLVSAMDSS